MKEVEVYEVKEEVVQKVEQKITVLRVVFNLLALLVIPAVLVGFSTVHNYSAFAGAAVILIGSVIFCVASGFTVLLAKRLLTFKYLKEVGL